MTAKFIPVEVGIHDGDHVEIVSGIKDGTRSSRSAPVR
jgi:hypothetical protein